MPLAANIQILRSRPYAALTVMLAIITGLASAGCSPNTPKQTAAPDICLSDIGGEVLLPAGSFIMGDNKTYREEGPAHRVSVDSFWMDVHEVTNQQFAAFTQATGYITAAERAPDMSAFPDAPADMLKPGSAVFVPPEAKTAAGNWWSYVPGASWKHPEGPGSSLTGKDNFPVVHTAFEDAKAYAKWAGRGLPTEAQYEYAARSGLEDKTYAWGNEKTPADGKFHANTWQGLFPFVNKMSDGYEGAAPAGCFPANSYGLYDLIGNVWEWTSNWYAPKHNPNDVDNPLGPPQKESFDRNNPGFPVKVIKGGSYLCADNFCLRYRPAARHAQDSGLGSNHIGFRTVRPADISEAKQP